MLSGKNQFSFSNDLGEDQEQAEPRAHDQAAQDFQDLGHVFRKRNSQSNFRNFEIERRGKLIFNQIIIIIELKFI